MSDLTDQPGSSVEPVDERQLATPGMPFDALVAPTPIEATPPPAARWLGFSAIVVGGLLGGMIGWGTGDVLGRTTAWAATGALIGAVGCAVGVGIVATLTLRAMNEWNEVKHPEADLPRGPIAATTRPTADRTADETSKADDDAEEERT